MKSARIFLMLLVIAWSGAGQQSNSSKTPPGPRRGNHRFNITYPDSAKTWTIGKTQVSSGSVSRTIANDLAARLVKKGFTRVRPLDVQCCTIQLELLYVAENQASSSTPAVTLSARITLLDIDQQNIYTKEYRGEAPATAVRAGKGLESAASELVTSVLADSNFMRPLAGS